MIITPTILCYNFPATISLKRVYIYMYGCCCFPSDPIGHKAEIVYDGMVLLVCIDYKNSG